MLIILNAIGLIVLLALLIVYYKKLKQLRGDPRRKKSIVQDQKSYVARDEEKGGEDMKQKRVAEGDNQENGKLAVMECVVGFELGDLLKASAESLGKGNFGRAVREEWTAEIFDLEMMVHRSGANGMLRLLQIAVRCCDKSPEKRPEMSEVVREVENIKVINVELESEEDYSMDQSLSLTDESISATAPSLIMDELDHER